MGQLFSSDEDYTQAQDAVGSILYDAMLEAGAVPDLGVVHPLLSANQDGSSDSQARLQEQLKQMQRDLGNRAPSYIKDLIGRLTTFSDEPQVAGLVGLMITLVVDMVYTSSRPSTGAKGKVSSSSSSQIVLELQEVMEEYLKRCRINLSQRKRLMEDSVRLEGMISLILTQLKACMLRGDCDSRSLRHWASGAVFHTQMLVHLDEPLVAREALQQYKEDLSEIIAAYRSFKSSTVQVMKCRSGFAASRDSYGEIPEDGAMTGLTVTDSAPRKRLTLSHLGDRDRKKNNSTRNR
ncbi:uncharacterized protein LOC112487811 isoform X2 [Cynoglossus semilaevis]|uniref:uncharacterized protein LOC112487811 isoform X2 n=1 Tax=Cynoglossus semilaevis TaxID=244447 RepID=UPI000D6244D9|nr:uncharacterized protein LOC112487811 isoform X2 [Cynoglossus semilaevis]